MQALMAGSAASRRPRWRGLKVVRIRDYLNSTVTRARRPRRGRLAGPTGDMVMLDLEAEGNYVAVRPSGTEPKVKFYMFAYDPPAAARI